MDKEALEGNLDRLDDFMLVAIATVAIGLIVELVPEFIPLRHTEILRRIGSALVTVGVTAEFFIELRHRKWDTQLRWYNNLEAEKLRKENLELQSLSSLREIGDKDKLVAAMKPFEGTHCIIRYDGSDFDSTALSWRLMGALQDAGWLIEQHELIGHPPECIWILLRKNEWGPRSSSAKAAFALLTWLNRTRPQAIKFHHEPHAVAPGVIVIQIGRNATTLNMRRFMEETWESQKGDEGPPNQLLRMPMR